MKESQHHKDLAFVKTRSVLREYVRWYLLIHLGLKLFSYTLKN